MEKKHDGAVWTVNTKIEKFNTEASYKNFLENNGKPDAVEHFKNNMLLNEGINLMWDLIAGASDAGSPFNHTNAHIGVGNNNGSTETKPAPGDTGLTASTKKLYLKMDEGYPKTGENQKIVFCSTALPGIACFEWLEWSIANGNGNQATGEFDSDCVRLTAQGNDPIPDPLPELNVSHAYGVTEANIINLNHKQENMGAKYSSATWIITCEISLV